MPDETDPAAEVLGIIADLAQAGEQASWQVYQAQWLDADAPAWVSLQESQLAHRAGFLAGMAFIAGQVEAVLSAIEEAGATDGAPEGSTGTGWPDYTRPSWQAPPAVAGLGEEAPTTDP